MLITSLNQYSRSVYVFSVSDYLTHVTFMELFKRFHARIIRTITQKHIVSSSRIPFPSQTLPYFVINKLHNLKGLPGMFTACLYAGALR